MGGALDIGFLHVCPFQNQPAGRVFLASSFFVAFRAAARRILDDFDA
jgi:hypothetical protein